MSDDKPFPMSRAERYTLIGWTSIILVCCIIGNTIILLATSRYRAIRLDKTSVVLIKYIAICDLVTGIFAVHPILASLLYGDWPYGTVSCYVFNYLKVPNFIAAILLICGLHLSKLHTLLYPLNALGRTNRQGHKISVVILFLSSIPSLVQIAIDSRDVAFDYRSFMCTYLSSAPIWKILSPVVVGLFMFLPNFIVIGTSIALLRVIRNAKTSNKQIQYKGRAKQGIRTVFYIGFTYIIVNGPLTFHLFVLKNVSQILSTRWGRFYEDNLFRAVFFFTFSTCFFNFFVYYRSVNSFNVFVRKFFKKARCLFKSNSSDKKLDSYRLRRLTRYNP